MVQGWPGLSQQAGCDQETGHTDRGAGDAGSEDNYLIISRRGEGDRRQEGLAVSLPLSHTAAGPAGPENLHGLTWQS